MWPMRTTPKTTITNRKATAAQPIPAELLERVSGADEACMLYAVHLFAQIYTVDLNRYRIPCNPNIENITDPRGALCWKDDAA